MIQKKTPEKHSFVSTLKALLRLCNKASRVSIRQIFKILSGKGYAALFIVLSFPFCLPLQVPGFSTPSGIILAFLGLRFSCGKRLWWPEWILNKSVSTKFIQKVLPKGIKVFIFTNKIFKPRLLVLTKNPFLHRLHGIIIFLLALLLLLPLPLPLTNLLSASPITLIGLGLLKEDGILIILGYILALLCFTAFLSLALLGTTGINKMLF